MSSIEDILEVSQQHDNTTDYTLFELDDTRANFEKDDIDAILLYQLTENPEFDHPLIYLKDCFNRCQVQRRKNKKNETLIDAYNEIDRLVVGYGLVTFQVENFCENSKDTFVTFLNQILSKFDSFNEFLFQLLTRAIKEGSTMEFLENFFNALLEITKDKDHFNINHSELYNTVLTVFEMFLSTKQAAGIFTKISNFLLDFNAKANDYETLSILGPILSLSPLSPVVALQNFESIAIVSNIQTGGDDSDGGENDEEEELDFNQKKDLKLISESLQNEHNIIIQRLFSIIDKLFRGSKESREDLLNYFAQIVNKNHLRRADYGQRQNKLASNAFMSNITILLIKFSQPFLDLSYSKINKIDINYFNSLNIFIDLSNETRVNSDFKEADEFYDKYKNSSDAPPNFISHCFFLTLTYLHYGIGGSLLYDEKITPQIKRLSSEVRKLEKVIARNVSTNNNFMNNFLKQQLRTLTNNLKVMKSLKYTLKSFFANSSIQTEIFDFIGGASTFLIRVIDPAHSYPFKPIQLPLIPDQIGLENVDAADYLRQQAPVPFKYYPEFIIEGLVNYSVYISKYSNSPLYTSLGNNARLNSFVELTTVLLRCPEIVSNPHLKSKIVQILSIGSYPLNGGQGFMMSIFQNNELVRKNLLYALLDFYVIVEKTGSSSQFYDKFNSRYSISIILQEIYQATPTIYKDQLFHQAKDNSDFFIRFIARMLNDLTFLLDEGLTNLSEVHNLHNQLASNPQPPQTENGEGNENDIHTRLASAQRQAKSSCGLATKSMILFEIFTRDLPRSFVTPEIVGRLASMLNYNLESLVGPKCGELKVSNPEAYSFNPKELLKSLCTIYINLCAEEEFIDAVSRDTRSFKVSLFERAVNILGRKIGLVSPEFCDKLMKFAKAAQEKKDEEEENDLELGEVPDEFLDPLMYTIMKDPVTLPTSHVNIDRSTIKAHLLSDSTDPFNRNPLKLQDVISNDELKKKIQDFIADKKAAKKKESI
ncbi:ubiquitin-ubiquitin ligase UFD2 NDAI_0A02930 [Naumovozyma dairenensis CBS 421]|uniref:RING-type E3 ubiquitin transferase n=1 Tax=Naumovozyma dairenensis (strain ATCC 10597 / BCRC 20456 / CBS 421 / NBRC 0211 / NRRL Y-12639) TaxID=1071378 RepID=G0W3R2_NAUDC|nr:hypothetical protein NDAI_0A02930 [Naumovozyma dairenensis CBS 421]CCD22450.1 hypothetical protein NDAI_0A02930 [Naumovozyma dairenensis CBS 421]